MREPCDGKLSRTVLRGAWRGDTPSLLSSGNKSEFVCDAVGQRVKIVETQSNSVTSTKQFIDSQGTMLEARDSSGNVMSQFYGKGQTISGGNYFYTLDQLNSIREMTDVSGAVKIQYQYDPYGRTTKVQGSLPSDFQYAGYYMHAQSGLCLTIFRAYNSNLGRWISRDPIGEAGGVNLYAYVNNRTIGASDPAGLTGTATAPPAPPPPAAPPAPPPPAPPGAGLTGVGAGLAAGLGGWPGVIIVVGTGIAMVVIPGPWIDFPPILVNPNGKTRQECEDMCVIIGAQMREAILEYYRKKDPNEQLPKELERRIWDQYYRRVNECKARCAPPPPCPEPPAAGN